ncbi:MAG: hypothetical protein HYV68_02490 [Candidatus Taylorbacteria bacterium]|nr:hypothetical protein [Candidatus Taylorbacteria bacterium]
MRAFIKRLGNRWQWFKHDMFLGWLAAREFLDNWYPRRVLGLCQLFHLDKWFATRVLGWEFDCFANPHDPDDYHFHTGCAIIRPRDYTFRWRKQKTAH